ncbi:MAG: helix-turn-helix domain-containing protein [Alphaproteobacteria bacterium]
MPDHARDHGIGDLARLTETKVPTIRYYEQIGVLPAPARTAGNQRRYGAGAVARLRFVRHARELGFPLAAVRELLDLADDPDRPCAEADAIASRQLIDVRKRIAALKALEGELQDMVTQCAGGRIEQCRVIEALSESA